MKRADEGLAARDTIEDLSPVVAQFSNGHRIHSVSVSPVRQMVSDAVRISCDLNVDGTGRTVAMLCTLKGAGSVQRVKPNRARATPARAQGLP